MHYLNPGSTTRTTLVKCRGTAVGSPEGGTCYFGGDFGWALFGPIPALFVVGELLCDVDTPLEP